MLNFFGYERLFKVESHTSFEGFHYLSEAIFYIFLGLACVFFGKLYVQWFHFIKRRVFEPLPLPFYVKPLIGGLLIGLIGFFYKDSIGSGMGLLQDIFSGRLEEALQTSLRSPKLELFKLLALLAFLRTINTSFTIGSGGSGGIFVPSLVVGGLIGAAFGSVYQLCFPEITSPLSSYTIVGMGGFFAGVANAPIASMFMVIEITGAYHLLPPLMMVSIISVVFSKKVSIYTNQVVNRFASPSHLWDMQVDVLKKVRVVDLIEQGFIETNVRWNIVLENTSLMTLKKIFQKTHSSHFVVVDEKDHYLGNAFLRELPADLNRSLIACDLIDETKYTIQLQDYLPEALEIMSKHNLNIMAVLDKQKVVSLLEYKSILKYYQKRMKQYSATRSSSTTLGDS